MIDLNEHTRFILGRPNFMCSSMAELLRADGHAIDRKSEDEQAAVIHWLLGLYERHGNDWAANYVSEVDRIKRNAESQERQSTALEGKTC